MMRVGMAACLVLAALPCGAADLLDGPGFDASAPRYFPRSDGGEEAFRRPPRPRARLGCVPRRAPVPTNAPDDPSYVGSAYGLSKPSYYGFTPPLGVDDPFGRSPLPYCP